MKLDPPRPDTPLSEAMANPALTGLTPIETLVYLRLVAMSTKGPRVYPTNAELHRANNDATIRALRALEERGLVRVRQLPSIRKKHPSGREITVLR